MAIFFNDLVEITGLTTGSWQTKDLSGAPWSVPTSAKGLILVTWASSTAVGYGLRKPGSSNNRINSSIVYRKQGSYVGCVNAQFEYYVGSSIVKHYLAGYFEDEAVFFTNGVAQTGFTLSVWTTVTAPAEVPSGAKAVIVEYLGGVITAGARAIGSSMFGHAYHIWNIAPLDASKQYQIFNGDSSPLVYVVGYITQGKWYSNYPDVSVSVAGSYQDKDLSSEAPSLKTGALIHLKGAYNIYDIRPDGITTERYTNQYGENGSYPVRMPTNSIFEGKIANVVTDFYLIGFLESYIPPLVIVLSTPSLTNSCFVGEDATSQTFDVWGTGGTLNYTISDDVAWLACDPASGTSTGEHDTITVNYTTSGLALGTHSAIITIEAAGADNTPQTISVSLDVTPPTTGMSMRHLKWFYGGVYKGCWIGVEEAGE